MQRNFSFAIPSQHILVKTQMKEPVAKCSFQAQTENQFIKNLLRIAVQENFSNFFFILFFQKSILQQAP